MAIKDITGMRSGKLVAVCPCGFLIEKNGGRRAMWRCKCDCGNITTASSQEITLKRKQSCGCLRGRKRRVVEEQALKDIKVVKEQVKDFGEFTVVVIDGECYFLFSEINSVIHLERRSRFMSDGYTEEAFRGVLELHGWRIENIPEIGEQLLINFPGVRECYTQAKRSLYLWADDEGIGAEKEEEMKKQLFYFFQRVGNLHLKYWNRKAQEEKNMPIIKALTEITGDYIFV